MFPECNDFASDPNCTLQSTSCDPEDMLNGQCTFESRQYRCMTQAPQSNTVTDCSGQVFCQDGKCFDTGYQNDPDFAKAMALMEAARQAGTYMDPNSMRIFGGSGSECVSNAWFGLKKCCKSKGGAKTNNDVMTQLLFSAIGTTAGSALTAGGKVASAYMYDFMFQSDVPFFVEKAVDAWSFGSWSGDTTFLQNFKPGISMYGFTLSYSFGGSAAQAAAQAATSNAQTFFGQWLNAYNSATQTIWSGGGFSLQFNPYALAFYIGMQLLQELMSCDQSEQILALRRGQNLCVNLGEYCSKKIKLIGCVEKKRGYCCFNSRLARIINEQGRPQIGKSWGSPKNPDCSGFTQDEFQRIDFSRIDLTEFMNEVMANVTMPNLSGIQQNIQGVVQQKMQNYYERGSQ